MNSAYRRTGRKARARSWTSSRAAKALIVCLSFGLVAGCSLLDKGLETVAPDKVETSRLERPENAALIVNSAVGDFECALGSFVVAGGLMSNELVETTQTASRWIYDRRDIASSDAQYSTFGCEGLGVYTPVSIARGTADNALRLLQGWTDAQVPNRTNLIAIAAAYAGYSRILLGEAFCEAAIDKGPKLTSDQIFALAEERFTLAIDAAKQAGNSSILNMAYVGRARARLDQGKKTEAAADAALVTPGFVIYATAEAGGSDRRQNRVYAENNDAKAVTVSPQYRNLNDPRVPVSDAGKVTQDNQTPLFVQQKYPTAGSPIPIASYKEAQLILREPQGGATPTLIEDRRRDLFLEGQRLYDVRRLNLPLVPAPGLSYSTVYAKGGTYGSQRCMPLPDIEIFNNPNL